MAAGFAPYSEPIQPRHVLVSTLCILQLGILRQTIKNILVDNQATVLITCMKNMCAKLRPK